jgi:hypothetical protein
MRSTHREMRCSAAHAASAQPVQPHLGDVGTDDRAAGVAEEALIPRVRTLYFAYLDEFPLPRGWAANITGSPAPERAGSSPPGASRS